MDKKMTNTISQQALEQYRNDTTGCESIVHFNNAGTSLPPDIVVDTVIDYLREEALVGGYEMEAKHLARIETVYEQIAKLIGADKSEVAVCENASAAWLTAFKGLRLQPGDEVITCELEYASNLMGLIDARKAGVIITVIGNDERGNFPLEKLEAAINPSTKLIAVTHIPSSGGGMLPITAIGAIAKKHGILYMVDACQTAGQYPIDVNVIGCDILSATGRKYLRAPRGTGFLYVRASVQDRIAPLLIDQHAVQQLTPTDYTLRPDARRYECYEKNRALMLGMGKAIEYALTVGVEAIWERVQGLATHARAALRTIPGVTVHDIGDELCGIVTFSVAGMDSLVLRDALIARGINVSFSGPSATLLYMNKRKLTGIVRASIHYYNTEEEITQLCEMLSTL
ncbi:MAG: aminotransferase class V-fold PLP-dependent enzyme [Chitinophagaceae bacterium]